MIVGQELFSVESKDRAAQNHGENFGRSLDHTTEALTQRAQRKEEKTGEAWVIAVRAIVDCGTSHLLPPSLTFLRLSTLCSVFSVLKHLTFPFRRRGRAPYKISAFQMGASW
jgi:hypothetical protein